jgi:enolase-phosphatase E1
LRCSFRDWRIDLIRAIVTDIEGTTSSIHFVKEVLFPYAARVLPDFIGSNADRADVRAQLDAAARDGGVDRDDLDAIVALLLQWIREDKKATPLKSLQGMVWEVGYRNGDYRAHVYEDAVVKLKEWHRQGLPLYVYSSGSIQAQKQFFGFSDAGDLTPLFSGYFDTTSGPKRDVQSYRTIAKEIGIEPAELLFLSDIVEELDAAKAAGFKTCWLVRPQDTTATPAQLQHSAHPVANVFSQISAD